MEKQRLVDSFHKNSVELIKINIQQWKTQDYVDIRIWYLEKPSAPGTETATKKGITLNVELLARFIEALEKAQETLKRDKILTKKVKTIKRR